MGDERKPIYNIARTVVGTSREISAAREIHIASGEALVNGLNAYGGFSKLEDDSGRFASKLRESEENLKNDLGGRSFFKREMDIEKYWDAGLLEEFKDFEGVVGTNYAKFIGNVYAKLDKGGDVLVSRKRKVGVGVKIVEGASYAFPGLPGALAGVMMAGVAERIITGVPVELSSPFVVGGAIVGAVSGISIFMYTIGRSNMFTNPLSGGADDLEKRVGVIKEALDLNII